MASSYITFDNSKLLLAMAERHITSKTLVKKTGIAYGTILRCIHEERVNVSSAAKVANALNKSIYDLV